MSNGLISKDNLTAYERWELPTFNSSDTSRITGIPSRIKLPTAAEIEEIQTQAHDEGYLTGQQAGYQEGQQAGHQEGYQAGYEEGSVQAALETEQLAALVVSMGQAVQQADKHIAQSLLDLAIERAQQMVRQALKVNPEIVLPIVREAIKGLPHFNPGAHIVLHPEDAEFVRTRIGEQLSHSGWKLLEDEQLVKGGVRIETANSQVDATVETRWQRLIANLGQDSSWLQK